jgi:hypothetical protein
MIAWRAADVDRLRPLLCIMMTLLAVLLRTGHAQTTLTPGVTPPVTFSSPLGLRRVQPSLLARLLAPAPIWPALTRARLLQALPQELRRAPPQTLLNAT